MPKTNLPKLNPGDTVDIIAPASGCSEQHLARIGHAKLVLRISLLVVPIEIPLIYALIFGKFGFPACGIAGVGYGLTITYTVTAIALVLYLLKSKYYRHYQIFLGITKINLLQFKELIRVGLPIGMMHAIEVGAFTVMTFWVSQFGTSVLAAHQITLQYLGIAITLVFAMSQAVSIRVGHEVGRKDLSGVYYSSFVGTMISFACVVVVALLFHFTPQLFLRLDIDIHAPANRELIQHASQLLSIAAVLLLFDNFRITFFGALRGLKETRFPMYVSFISFWLIGLSFSFLLAFVGQRSGAGAWWGMTTGIAAGAIIIFIRLFYVLRGLNVDKLASLVTKTTH